jgi:hypothetical protein
MCPTRKLIHYQGVSITNPTAFLFLIESGCLDDNTGPRSSAQGAPHTSGIGLIPT